MLRENTDKMFTNIRTTQEKNKKFNKERENIKNNQT